MSFTTLRNSVRTLRFQVVFWSTAVAFLLIVISLFLVHNAVRLTNEKLFDEFLGEELDWVCAKIQANPDDLETLTDQLERRADSYPIRKVFIQLLDSQGKVCWSSVHSPSLVVPADFSSDSSQALQVGNYRFLEKGSVVGKSDVALARVGMSLDILNREMSMVSQTMIGLGVIFLVLAPLACFVMVTRALRPITAIVATARRLSPANLKERLPLLGGGGELDQVSETINNLLDRISRYIQMNQELVANAAHELRSPLAAMRGSLELALNSKRSVEEYQDLIVRVIEECDDLSDLQNKLLILTEGDEGTLCPNKEPVALEELVENAVDVYRAVAESNRLALEAPRLEPLTVNGDRRYLARVLNNLLDNAVKYTLPGGVITVELFSVPGKNNACVKVTDTGVGIPPEDMHRIFQRFFRGDKSRQRNSQTQGHGLGLSLCQAIVKAHGGTIEFSSAPGKGTSFTVMLPCLDHARASTIPVAIS